MKVQFDLKKFCHHLESYYNDDEIEKEFRES